MSARRQYHAVTCTPEQCDPPRSVAYVASRGRDGSPRRIEVVRLEGCPLAAPDLVVHRISDELRGYLLGNLERVLG